MNQQATLSTRSLWGVHLVLLFVQLAFASLHVEGKLVMGPEHQVSPQALAMMRIGGAALFLLPIYLFWRRTPLPNLKDCLMLAVLGILGVVNNQWLYLMGLSLTSPLAATLLVALIPVFTLLLAWIFQNQRVSHLQKVGIGLAVLGIWVLSGLSLPQWGDTLVLLNALSFAAYVLFSPGLIKKYGPLSVMSWVFFWSFVIFLPFGGPYVASEYAAWSPDTWYWIAYIVVVPSILAYGANAWALTRTTPSMVTSYIFLQPLAVVALVWLQFGEAPAPLAVYAAPLILLGIHLVLKYRAR